MEQGLPKILVVSRMVWDDSSNSNTLTNIFRDYDPDKIARIYIETKRPNTKCCHHFFQISEISLIKKLFHWNLKTGRVIDTNDDEPVEQMSRNESQETSVMSFVRNHRSFLFTWLRDLLWLFGGWKSKDLKDFIKDFDPDVLWLDGSPLILMNRLNNYVIKLAKKPAVTFLMDDAYSYKSCASLSSLIYRSFIRRHIRKTVDQCKHVFVASPKMKEEYDSCFGIDSTFLSKAIDGFEFDTDNVKPHQPIRMVYLGNLLIGRADTLAMISKSIRIVNAKEPRIQLHIYSHDYSMAMRNQEFMSNDNLKLFPPVPYHEVSDIIANSDVQIFAESLKGNSRKIARLSFSTKIIDYLAGGKCIFAVGPADIAPIEYFNNEDAAVVATSEEQITEMLLELCNPGVIEEYSRKGYECGMRNHLRSDHNDKLFSILKSVSLS